MPETVDLQALFQEGLKLHQSGTLDQAEKVYRQVLAQQPGHFDALHMMGVIALQVQKFPQAIALIEKAIAADPGNPSLADAYINRGAALRSLLRFEDAVVSYDHAIVLNPGNTNAHFNRAAALRYLGRHEAAIEDYDAVIVHHPADADAFYNRGLAQYDLKQHEAAVASFDAVIRLQPDHVGLYRVHGDALSALKRHEPAIESYDKAIVRDPQDADAHYGRAVALTRLSRHQEALASYDKAVGLNPKRAEFHYNRGMALFRLQHYQKAIDAFDTMIALEPGSALVYVNRGIALAELSQTQAALDSFDKAVALNPNAADAHFGRGNALANMKRYEEAIESYDKAAALKPLLPYLQGARLHTKLTICDWRNFSAEIAEVRNRIARGEKAAPPFANISLINASRLQHKAIAMYASLPMAQPLTRTLDETRRARERKIRVGYFSMDFRNHAVGFVLAPLIEAHDREKFEIWGFAFGPPVQDETRKRLESAFDVFVDVAADSDAAVVGIAREKQIDIAVDLAGYTAGCRPGIFAHRAAPIQVNYLGYPGTTGSTAMDYIVADWTVIPAASEVHYSEKVARLPSSYLPTEGGLEISEKIFTREELGLPPTGFVYCCFNNSYKITPETFDVWMRILKNVEDSVLWLRAYNTASVTNLRAEAERRGVAGGRLIFAGPMPRADHLARHRAADLFLDTLSYNAHTTGSEALWAGLPVLTCMGDAFASRVAASLLRAVGLPELIATTVEAYEALAMSLAGDRARLAGLRQKLGHLRATAPLFNTPAYTKDLEALYTRMVAHQRAGLPPAHMNSAVQSAY